MYSLCEGMKWAHLPNAGGLYDQSPELLDGFKTIFGIKAQHEEEEREKDKRERDQQMGRNGGRGRSRSAARRPK